MQIPECLPCAQQMFSMHLLFRIILQYEADFQPRLLFFFQKQGIHYQHKFARIRDTRMGDCRWRSGLRRNTEDKENGDTEGFRKYRRKGLEPLCVHLHAYACVMPKSAKKGRRDAEATHYNK